MKHISPIEAAKWNTKAFIIRHEFFALIFLSRWICEVEGIGNGWDVLRMSVGEMKFFNIVKKSFSDN